jgi:hypothetical protein
MHEELVLADMFLRADSSGAYRHQLSGVGMNRLEQDAADTLAAYEQRQAIRNRARADWERAQQPEPTKTWAPVHTEQQKGAFQRYSERHNLPF